MDRREILRLAEEMVMVDRQEEHGPPEQNLGRIAKLWGAYLGVSIGSSDACAMMILLKVSRLAHKKSDDSFIDIAGYASLGAELASTIPTDKKHLLLRSGIYCINRRLPGTTRYFRRSLNTRNINEALKRRDEILEVEKDLFNGA